MPIELNILNFAFVPLSDESISDDDKSDIGDGEDLDDKDGGVPDKSGDEDEEELGVG